MKNTRRKLANIKRGFKAKQTKSYAGIYDRPQRLMNRTNEPVELYTLFSKEKIREEFTKSKLLQKMDEDFSKADPMPPYLHEEVRQSFEKIFEILSPYQPDQLGLEYTNENTLYIFAKVKEWDIHLETDFEEEVFCTLSVFESNEIALNMSDSVESCLNRLSKLLKPPTYSSDVFANQYIAIIP